MRPLYLVMGLVLELQASHAIISKMDKMTSLYVLTFYIKCLGICQGSVFGKAIIANL